ncbi:MAG TPA: glycosyltransferase family 1 protein [Leucothrix sp.]|nr:glycosyltransferase family 1 protein [Leucothrix sp.]
MYGKNWKKLIPKKYIKGDHIPNEQLYLHYGAADILLNDHWSDMRKHGFVSNRIFDGLACGAFIITDKVEGAGELEAFLGTYETKSELLNTIEYYLNHPDERLEKSKKGMEYVLKGHTFKERAEQLSNGIKVIMESYI